MLFLMSRWHRLNIFAKKRIHDDNSARVHYANLVSQIDLERVFAAYASCDLHNYSIECLNMKY